MDRDAFIAGRDALKTKIKELSTGQKRDKGILRMPRKTTKNLDAIKAALEQTDYACKDSATLQYACVLRRPVITAYLVVYAKVRGKLNSHRPGKEYYLPEYNRYIREAQALFDSCTKS